MGTEPKVLLDTNILLDLVTPSRPDHKAANALLEKCTEEAIRGYVLASSLKDFYYIGRRYNADYLRRAAIKEFMQVFEVLPLKRITIDVALNLQEPDLEDSMVLSAAYLEGIDIICTRDKAGFLSSGIKKMNTMELLEYIKIYD